VIFEVWHKKGCLGSTFSAKRSCLRGPLITSAVKSITLKYSQFVFTPIIKGGERLARVLVSLKIFPSDVNVGLDALKKKIEDCLPEFASVYKFEEEPIAFGLVAIIAHLLVPEDKAGGIDEVEEALKKIDVISNLQTLTIRRV